MKIRVAAGGLGSTLDSLVKWRHVACAIRPRRCDTISMGESPVDQKELGQTVKKWRKSGLGSPWGGS